MQADAVSVSEPRLSLIESTITLLMSAGSLSDEALSALKVERIDWASWFKYKILFVSFITTTPEVMRFEIILFKKDITVSSIMSPDLGMLILILYY
jgi:hypothetical protein